MKRYFLMAIATRNGGYTVGEHKPDGRVLPLFNVRTFDTFDEADECAKAMAAGKYPDCHPGGEYVGNR